MPSGYNLAICRKITKKSLLMQKFAQLISYFCINCPPTRIIMTDST